MRAVALAAGESFAALLMIVNPLAAVPVFISLTDRLTIEQPRIAFAPMAVPLLAGPGAMGAVMALDARDAGSLKYVGFAAGIIAVTVIVCICTRGASRINGALGETGLDAMTRILGLFIFALGAEMVIHGIVTHSAVTELRKM